MQILNKKEVEILNKSMVNKISNIQKCNADELAKMYTGFEDEEVLEELAKLEKRSGIKSFDVNDKNHELFEKIGAYSDVVGVYFVDSKKLKKGAKHERKIKYK